jgi:hypothetical protein
MHLESQAATSLVLESYALSLLFLACRVSKGGNQAISAMMQIFAILKKLEELGLLCLLDLCTWRALFVACDEIMTSSFSSSPPVPFFTMMIFVLYDLMKAVSVDEMISSDIYIAEIYSRCSSKKIKIKGKSFKTKQLMSEEKPYLDLGYACEQIGLIWYNNKLCDTKRKFDHTTNSPIREKGNRARSNSVPTSVGSTSVSPAVTPQPLTQPTIWQRFKSQKSISIEDDNSDRILLSEQSLDEVLGLEPDSSPFNLKRFPNSGNWITIATEARSVEELKLQQEIALTAENFGEKVQNWKNFTKPETQKIEKGMGTRSTSLLSNLISDFYLL